MSWRVLPQLLHVGRAGARRARPPARRSSSTSPRTRARGAPGGRPAAARSARAGLRWRGGVGVGGGGGGAGAVGLGRRATPARGAASLSAVSASPSRPSSVTTSDWRAPRAAGAAPRARRPAPRPASLRRLDLGGLALGALGDLRPAPARRPRARPRTRAPGSRPARARGRRARCQARLAARRCSARSVSRAASSSASRAARARPPRPASCGVPLLGGAAGGGQLQVAGGGQRGAPARGSGPSERLVLLGLAGLAVQRVELLAQLLDDVGDPQRGSAGWPPSSARRPRGAACTW